MAGEITPGAIGQAPNPALRGYAICGEQRSGSSYLCQLLASTGVLGRPLEYFNGAGMASFQPGYPQDAERQLQEIMGQGASANGIYGVKLFSADFDRVARISWATRLPNLHFIRLARRDLLGQAISVTRAAQTRQYSADATAVGKPTYDRVRIAQEIHRIAWGQARWAAFFARCGIAPLELEYEEIAASPQEVVERVARFMQLDETPKIDPSQVYTRVQRDSTSEQWRAQFVAEARDLDFLDKPLPPSYRTRIARLAGRIMGRGAPGSGS